MKIKKGSNTEALPLDEMMSVAKIYLSTFHAGSIPHDQSQMAADSLGISLILNTESSLEKTIFVNGTAPIDKAPAGEAVR